MGWCGLLLYVALLSPVGLAAAATLGSLDADHHAILQVDANGIRLVLHHQGDCAGHRHHAVARALTLFAQPTSATDPDHVVQFSSATSLSREARLAIPASNQTDAPTFAFAELLVCVPINPTQFLRFSHPPPNVRLSSSELFPAILRI